ncbi:MAG: 3-hydroxybutyryl-CoA dehydrogenase [bacterium]|nr:3-hydroxybutyryl-CoA dehydrogenase [bacterium]MDE0602162.1 3-hydroxybutyryl-CoA dehydrogenase [bacterium]
MNITRVGVVGGGLMGSGIAEVCARAGCDVTVVEADSPRAEAAYQRILASTGKAVARGKMTADEQDSTLAKVTVTDDLDSLSRSQLVIEAVSEVIGLKLTVFERLDQLVEDHETILASNTSSIPIARLGAATTRPENVVGIHFFNPAPVMKLVEVIPTISTSEDTLKTVNDFVSVNLGKSVVLCRDQAGFVVNGLVVPFLMSAVRMLEAGVATREDIDTAVKMGLNHPMGPFELADFIGLDTIYEIGKVLYDEFRDPANAPPPLLARLVESGWTGRKSGRGFYSYL